MNNQFNIVCIGNSDVGKTTFLKRFSTGEFEKNYIPTEGTSVYSIEFYTSYGKYILNICDCSGRENNPENYIGADGALIFFDVTNPQSHTNIWAESFGTTKPFVLCGNKCDRIRPKNMDRNTILISAKSNYNFEKPFLYLLRKITGNENILPFSGPVP